MRSRELDWGDVAEMRRLWKKGTGAVELAARFGVSTEVVWRRCEPALFGIVDDDRSRAAAEAARRKLRQRRRATVALHTEIRRLWGEGFSGKALAQRFGLARSTVSGIARGLPSRRRYGDPEDVAWPHPRRFGPKQAQALAGRDVPASGESLPARPIAPKGSAHGRAKLDESKVARMKRLRLQGWSTGALAREFGVGRNTVCYVVNGKTWAHVEPAPSTKGETA
jgi:hypothetical protein